MRELLPNLFEQRFVMGHIPIGVKSSNGVNLVNMRCIAFEISDVLLNAHGICIVCLGSAAKGAKPACKDANIGLIDVNIAVKICMISKPGRSHMMSQTTNFVEVGVLKQSHTIIQAQVNSVHKPLYNVLYGVGPA